MRNHSNAASAARAAYIDAMSLVCGAGRPYCRQAELFEVHGAALATSLACFDRMATLQSSLRVKSKKELAHALLGEWQRFEALNAERDPYKSFAIYAVPMVRESRDVELTVTFDFVRFLLTSFLL